MHHGENRSDVYRRLFQVLWFGNHVGRSESNASLVPTYVYPADLLAVVRQRFPDVNAGRRDAEFAAAGTKVHNVSWNELALAKWPNPPKACKLCNTQAKKPY